MDCEVAAIARRIASTDFTVRAIRSRATFPQTRVRFRAFPHCPIECRMARLSHTVAPPPRRTAQSNRRAWQFSHGAIVWFSSPSRCYQPFSRALLRWIDHRGIFWRSDMDGANLAPALDDRRSAFTREISQSAQLSSCLILLNSLHTHRPIISKLK